MPLDLKLVVWSTALTVVQMLVAVLGITVQAGLPAVAGNREGLPEATGWAGRAQRAHRNMLESLVLFAVLVLVTQAAGKANAVTALGAQLFSGGGSSMRWFTSRAFRGCAPPYGSCRSSA